MEKIDITPEELYNIIELLNKGQTSINAEAKKRGMDRSTLSKKIKDYKNNPVKVVAEHMDKEFQEQQLNTENPGEGAPEPENQEKEPEIKPENITNHLPEDRKLDVEQLKKRFPEKKPEEVLAQQKAKVREDSEKAPVEKITFTLSMELTRALRMMGANENIKVIDIVKDLFYNGIDPKYFKKL